MWRDLVVLGVMILLRTHYYDYDGKCPKITLFDSLKMGNLMILEFGKQNFDFFEEFRGHSFRFLNIAFCDLGEVFVCQIFGGLDET